MTTNSQRSSSDAVAHLGARMQLVALWTCTMLLVAFVDIFGLYRADVREQIEAGRILGFDIGGGFMFGIAVYVAVPTLMIALNVLASRRLLRVLNAVIAAVFGVTIIGAAVGEWAYYLFISALELALLTAIFVVSARWKS